MKKIFISLAAIAALVSCVEEKGLEPQPQQPVGNQVTIKAVAAETKTVIADDGTSIVWENGDAISLIFDYGTYKSAVTCETELTEPNSSADFKADLTDVDYDKVAENVNLLYPASAFNTSESKITFKVPAEQDGTVGTGDNLSYALLTKTVIAGGTAEAHFKNALSLFKITVPAGVKTLKLTADRHISGTATYKFNDGGVLQLQSTDQGSSNSTVILSSESGLDADRTYDVLVYPGDIKSLALELIGTDGAAYTKTLKNDDESVYMTLEAGKYYDLKMANLFLWMEESFEITASPLEGELVIEAATTADYDYSVVIKDAENESITPDWISATPIVKGFHKDNITLYLTTNDTGATRKAKVTVSYGEKSQVFTVIQNSAFMDFVYTEEKPIKWVETFDVYPSEEDAQAGTNKKIEYTNVFTISLTTGDECKLGTYKVENIFKTDKYNSSEGQVAGKGGVYYAKYSNNQLILSVDDAEKSYFFQSNVVLTYDSDSKKFTSGNLLFHENPLSDVWKGAGVIANYSAIESEEQASDDITGTYSASGKYGSGSHYTSTAFSDTFTITANSDAKGQYKITGLFNVCGGGGGTYYANFADNVLTILAANSTHDNYLGGGSLPNDVTMNYSSGTFTIKESILIANTYGDCYIGKDYTATKQ